MSETSEASKQTLETPFNMMKVGMTGCGKTHYLLSMLEEEYFGHFECIFLICPTYNWNKTYQEWTTQRLRAFLSRTERSELGG